VQGKEKTERRVNQSIDCSVYAKNRNRHGHLLYFFRFLDVLSMIFSMPARYFLTGVLAITWPTTVERDILQLFETDTGFAHV